MRVIIVALAIVALALAHEQADNVKPKICTPGSTKNMECNHCICASGGTDWACTLKGCFSGILTIANSDDSTSHPEPTGSSDRSRLDTESANESPEDNISIKKIQVCQPGDTKWDDCNSCFCTDDGARWACTKMGCHIETISSLQLDTIATQP